MIRRSLEAMLGKAKDKIRRYFDLGSPILEKKNERVAWKEEHGERQTGRQKE